tara:strand:+ start:828 stop:1463 length:636 start_codon:yes stop_codon:yes gene_type:complete
LTEQVKFNGMAALFASPVFMSEIIDTRVLDNTVNSILKLKENKDGVETFGSWVTRDDLHILPEFEELTNILLSEAERALDILTIKRDSHYIPCMWANVSQVGSAHMEHIHANSIYSGVLYLQSPEGSQPTIFADPRPGAQMFQPDYEKPNPNILGARWSTTGERGGIIIFPSWLPHSVQPVPPTAEERITLSFNIMIKSTINDFTKKVSFK